eukprot:TRINITY_DN30908_c0_g1_i1.p1 TRINITY_DN30908_c0_g1~~TRINITY_DN30908_c0_g1_i1.p1  ORF type:complete len:339 (-),score=76.49 TRINITY_DN30908_c0_g1_i1:46-1062(-)
MFYADDGNNEGGRALPSLDDRNCKTLLIRHRVRWPGTGSIFRSRLVGLSCVRGWGAMWADLLEARDDLVAEVSLAAERLGLAKLSLLCSAAAAQKDESAAQPDLSSLPTLAAELAQAVGSAECSDVALVCDDGRSLPCHRVVLASRNAYFSSMFEGGMRESRQHQITLPDLDWEIAWAILEHLYGEITTITPDNALDLLAATNLYRLEQMKSLCEMALMQWVDVDNAVSLLQAAEMHSASMLKAFCKNFISMNFDSIANTDAIPEILLNLDDLGIRKRLRKAKSADSGESSDDEGTEADGQRKSRRAGRDGEPDEDEEDRWSHTPAPSIPTAPAAATE